MSYYRVYHFAYRGEETDKHVYFNMRRPDVKKLALRPHKGQKGSEKREGCNLSRAKRTILEYGYCNLWDLFCTFTFSPEKHNRYDYVECRRVISELFHNYKKRYSSDFRYMVIPEFHKDGAIHFHGFVHGIRKEDLVIHDYIQRCNKVTGQYELIPNVNRYKDWPYYSEKAGWFSCSKIKDKARASRYITKYITKDMEKLPMCSQCFLASKGLQRAELIFDMDDLPPMQEPEFKNEFIKLKWCDSGAMYDNFGIIDAVCTDLHSPEKPDVYEQVRLDGDVGQRFNDVGSLLPPVSRFREGT